ncbi:major facilitator superfamily domain-containing protein [Aspergillus insuetus]
MAQEHIDASGHHIELIPGTEVFRVVENDNDQEILRPRLSTNPDDPLNWTRTWKFIAISTQTVYLFASVASALSIGPMYPLLGAEFGLSDTQLNLLTGAAVLLLGYSNFIVVPLSNVFGRRFVAIALCTLSVGTSIWEALSGSYNVLLAARIVNGFAISTTETLMVQVVVDLFFLHERGFWMGVYFTAFFVGLYIGPIISGNIAAAHGWRSFFWLSTGLSAFVLVILIFFFPETKWHTVYECTDSQNASNEGRKPSIIHNEHSQLEVEIPKQNTRGRPAKKAFRLLTTPDPRWRSFILKDIISCAQIMFFPIVFWAGLCLAGCANLLLLWNLTQSSVLSAPPFNFSVSNVGYSNFSFLVGSLFGLATAGPLSDWYAQRATRRNNGIREAEFRLPILLPYFVLTVIGIAIGGCAVKFLWPWPVLVIMGYCLTGLCVTSIPTIAIAYAVDSYKEIAGEIMVVGTVLKNTCGFGMSYWVVSLTKSSGGNLAPVMVQLALVAGPVIFTLPLWIWGKELRRLSRDSRVHLSAMSHGSTLE